MREERPTKQKVTRKDREAAYRHHYGRSPAGAAALKRGNIPWVENGSAPGAARDINLERLAEVLAAHRQASLESVLGDLIERWDGGAHDVLDADYVVDCLREALRVRG